MKKYIPLLLVFNAPCFSASIETFTIKSVGASNGTNTIFVDTVEKASESNCEDSDHFKLPVDDRLGKMFFSAALAAKSAGKRMTIYYEVNDCLFDAVRPHVFKVVD